MDRIISYTACLLSAIAITLVTLTGLGNSSISKRVDAAHAVSCQAYKIEDRSWTEIIKLITNARTSAQARIGTSKELPTDKKALVADTNLLNNIHLIPTGDCPK